MIPDLYDADDDGYGVVWAGCDGLDGSRDGRTKVDEDEMEFKGDVDVDVVGVAMEGMDSDLRVHLSRTIPLGFPSLPVPLPGRSSLTTSPAPSSPSFPLRALLLR